MSYLDIGDRIRMARIRIGMNQEELAELARLNRVTIAKYESGKVEPGAQAISRIADALEVSVDELLGRAAVAEKKREPHTLEARIVSGGMDKLPQEERDRIISVLQAMYSNHPELFDKGDDDE